MSKAFLRESDEPDDEPVPPPTAALPPGAKNYLTADGARRLRAELARLVETERPPLAAHTDDPEVKRDLQRLDRRIRALERSLQTAEIVTAGEGPAGVVRFGCAVTVRDRAGEEARYRIVGVDEIDPDRGEISWLSPLARALLNARVGQRVTFSTPRGPAELDVIAIDDAPTPPA